MAIKAYIADYKRLGIDKTWEKLLPYLTDAEREKVLRFKFDADKIRSVVGVCLIKSMAVEAFPGENITISVSEEGKPYLEGRVGYEFNLSHSGDLIVLAVDDLPVGIDVEQIKDKNWEIFHRYLTEAEMSMIRSSNDPVARFYEVWTIREAFFKEEGQGLRILDSDFSVDYDCRTIHYNEKELYFRTESYDSSDKYRISICSQRPPDDAKMICMTNSYWKSIASSMSSQNLHKNY